MSLFKFIENNIQWTREFEFCCHWFEIPLRLELFTINSDSHNGHICILNFSLYWFTSGEYINER